MVEPVRGESEEAEEEEEEEEESGEKEIVVEVVVGDNCESASELPLLLRTFSGRSIFSRRTVRIVEPFSVIERIRSRTSKSAFFHFIPTEKHLSLSKIDLKLTGA